MSYDLKRHQYLSIINNQTFLSQKYHFLITQAIRSTIQNIKWETMIVPRTYLG